MLKILILPANFYKMGGFRPKFLIVNENFPTKWSSDYFPTAQNLKGAVVLCPLFNHDAGAARQHSISYT